MVAWPRNKAESQWAQNFLFERGSFHAPDDSHYLFWIADRKPVWVFAFHGFMGWTCHASFASDKPRYLPRAFITAGFTYVFKIQRRKMLFVQVNSTNTVSLKLQHYLGFKELWRGPNLHTDGGDMVFLGIRAEECRWIKVKNEERSSPST